MDVQLYVYDLSKVEFLCLSAAYEQQLTVNLGFSTNGMCN
jgi:hypothetical protein